MFRKVFLSLLATQFAMKNIGFLLSLTILILSSCGPKVYNSGFDAPGPKQMNVPPRPDARPGECFKLAEIPREFRTETQTFYEFTGDTIPQAGVVKTEVELSPRLEDWIKKPYDNCQSADPNDCLVWCQVVEEAEQVVFYEVRDTTAIKAFKKTNLEVKRLIKDKSKEWVQVICENNINRTLIKTMSDSLRARNYFVVYDCEKSPKCLMESLKRYQMDRMLPVGSINLVTLDSLGVAY